MGGVCSKKAQGTASVEAPPVEAPVEVPAAQGRRSSTRARRLSVVNVEEGNDAAVGLVLAPASRRATLVGGATDRRGHRDKTEHAVDTKSASLRRLCRRGAILSQQLLARTVLLQETALETKVETASPLAASSPVEVEPPPLRIRHVERTTSSRSRLLFASDIGCLSQTGREPGFKKTNQDNCFAFEKFIRHGQSLYAAFDGHGANGHTISSFVKHRMALTLSQRLTKKMMREGDEEEILQTMRNVFSEVHENVVLPPIDAEFSGTTATLGLIMGSKLYTAWVGDSRCVVGVREADGRVVARDVTRDHKPDSSGEKERIYACGGRVKRLVDDEGNAVGPARVWMKYAWLPGLAMSRAIGDVCAHQIGVTSDPDVSVTEITSAVGTLIIASDGVWEFVSSQEAIDIVESVKDATSAARKLIDESYHRWLMEENGVVDDITAVVVKFSHFPQDDASVDST